MSAVGTLASLAVQALLLAGLYAVMSYGLWLVYGVMGIINVAHAGLVMLGAYTALTLWETMAVDPLLSSVFLIFPVFFGVGLGLYRALVQRIGRRGAATASLLLLFGFWLVLQNLAYVIWTGDTRALMLPYTFNAMSFGPVRVPLPQVLVFAVAMGLFAGLEWLFRTYPGLAIRATAQNREAASLYGIDVNLCDMLAFSLSVGLAGTAGGLLSILYAFTPDFGRPLLLKSFCIIVLGGMETTSGLVLGALALALCENFSLLVMPAGLQDMVSFILLVLVLALLPGGLGGCLRPRRKGVPAGAQVRI